MALTFARKLLILRSTEYEIGPFRASKYPFSANLLGFPLTEDRLNDSRPTTAQGWPGPAAHRTCGPQLFPGKPEGAISRPKST